MLSDLGKFVKGTDYRSVIRHEIGHVIANMYHIDSFFIARKVFPEKTDFQIIEYIHDNLSVYASGYKDGREFISECFSAYYSNIDIWFAKEYVKLCKEFVKEES